MYVNAVVVQLKDECSEGTAWDLWKPGQMETYSYDALAHQGRGIGTSQWNRAFGLDYCDPDGGITIWGNTAWKPPIQVYARFDSAPGGPQHKKSLNDYYALDNRKIEG